jgi:F0F1-type ATP synthase delta subunit
MIMTKKIKKSVFSSPKKNALHRTVLFYNNPVENENNFNILTKIANVEEMSVNEFLNIMIEEKRLEYFPEKKF